MQHPYHVCSCTPSRRTDPHVLRRPVRTRTLQQKTESDGERQHWLDARPRAEEGMGQQSAGADGRKERASSKETKAHPGPQGPTCHSPLTEQAWTPHLLGTAMRRTKTALARPLHQTGTGGGCEERPGPETASRGQPTGATGPRAEPATTPNPEDAATLPGASYRYQRLE